MKTRCFKKENIDIPSILDEKLVKGNFEEAVKITRKIKSSSGNISAKKLRGVAGEPQKALTNNEVSRIEELHKDFGRLLKQVLQEIENRSAPGK